jgi:hypothetical protein
MNYAIRIFCRAETDVTLSEVAEAVTEGGFLDEDPHFKPDPKSAEGASPQWQSLEVMWSSSKQPIIFRQDLRNDALREEIARLMFILEVSRKSEARQRVVDHLQNTVRMFSIEVQREEMTDATWAMLDAVEARLAKKCDGIVFTKDEGFFDKNLKHFYKL